VNIILDTCSLINLVNGEVFSSVLALPDRFVVGPIVLGEAGLREVDQALRDQRLDFLDDGQLSADQFLRAVEEHRIGDGEAECLVAATHFGYCICTDDGRARRVAVALLGSSRLTGTIGLLRATVSAGFLKVQDAYDAYAKMLACGAFLPTVSQKFFGTS